MEVSSHALDLERTWKTRFSVTAFTNLTQDHLDYHKTFDAYFEAKAFCSRATTRASRHQRQRQIGAKSFCAAAPRTATPSSPPASTPQRRSIPSRSITPRPIPTSCSMCAGAASRFSYPLVGRFNVENVMTAFAVGMQLGISTGVIVEALSDVPSVPGRLERVKGTRRDDISVYVDYAHTPDALTKAISSIKALSRRAPSWCSAAAATGTLRSDPSWAKPPSPPITPS